MASAAPYRLDRAAPAAPALDMVDAIVRFADVRRDLGGGRVELRMSPGRLAQADALMALGSQVRRAAEIAVIFDEREDEVVRTIDDARLKPQAHAWWEDYYDRFDMIEEEARLAA